MKIVTAPEDFIPLQTEIKCFLAGGITNCPDWQTDVINQLKKIDTEIPGELDRLVLFNPRRPNFPINDPNAAEEQITWEFKWLQQMDLFTMWFSGGDSDQPICMYELGRNLQRMVYRFPTDYSHRILISYDSSYKRAQDVKIQTELAFKELESKPIVVEKADVVTYAKLIVIQYNALKVK